MPKNPQQSKIRLLLLNYEFPPLGGGAANATSYLLKEYANDPEIEVDLVTSSARGFKIKRMADNITVHFLDIGKQGSLHFQTNKELLNYSRKSYFYSKKLFQKKDFNLMHAFFGIPSGFIAKQLQKKHPIPYIVSLRGSDIPFYNQRYYWLDRLVFQRLSRQVWKKAASVVALSHDSVKLAKKTDQKTNIKVIYNGINISEFKPQPDLLTQQNDFNILFVGRLIPRKGFTYLLEAFSQLVKAYPQIRLHAAGDGPLLKPFTEMIKSRGLQKKVYLYGRLEHKDVIKLYQKSHVFVLPSLNEALGNVTQEALACGLPIITTKTGAAELVHDNGFVVSKKSSSQIERNLGHYIENSDLRQKHSSKSRHMAESMSWEKVAEKYKKEYISSIK